MDWDNLRYFSGTGPRRHAGGAARRLGSEGLATGAALTVTVNGGGQPTPQPLR